MWRFHILFRYHHFLFRSRNYLFMFCIINCAFIVNFLSPTLEKGSSIIMTYKAMALGKLYWNNIDLSSAFLQYYLFKPGYIIIHNAAWFIIPCAPVNTGFQLLFGYHCASLIMITIQYLFRICSKMWTYFVFCSLNLLFRIL